MFSPDPHETFFLQPRLRGGDRANADFCFLECCCISLENDAVFLESKFSSNIVVLNHPIGDDVYQPPHDTESVEALRTYQ